MQLGKVQIGKYKSEDKVRKIQYGKFNLNNANPEMGKCKPNKYKQESTNQKLINREIQIGKIVRWKSESTNPESTASEDTSRKQNKLEYTHLKFQFAKCKSEDTDQKVQVGKYKS